MPPRPVVLVGAAAIMSGCVIAWALGPAPTSRIGRHLFIVGLAFAAYLVALAAARGLTRRGLVAALAIAVVWRVALVAVPPLLSDDVYRYVWEGRIQLHGGNPYAWPDRPEATRWAHLRDEVWDGVNHKDYPAIYPPLFQLAARGIVGLHDSVTAMKAVLVFCEVLTLAVLGLLLRRRGQPPERLLLLAWSPLALVEIAGSGHNEALGILWLALALLGLTAGRPGLSALAAAAGFASKLLPGLVAVAWARRYRLSHVAAGAALIVLLALPYVVTGRSFSITLSKYARFWRFNETLFAPLAAAFGHEGAVVLGALATLALALFLAWRHTEPVAAALAVVAATILMSPNVLPWYALWLLPLLVLRDAPGALLFTGTVSLAYLVYPAWQSGEPWRLGWGLRLIEYGPCLLVAALRPWRSRRAAPND